MSTQNLAPVSSQEMISLSSSAANNSSSSPSYGAGIWERARDPKTGMEFWLNRELGITRWSAPDEVALNPGSSSSPSAAIEALDVEAASPSVSHESTVLAWDISVHAKGRDKPLLEKATGDLLAGELVAIMGPSGSGKTTLLDVLACRPPRGAIITGDTRLFGRPYKSAQLKTLSGYVQQDDLLNGNLTVKETLHYTAQLRLDPDLSEEDKEKRVLEIIKLMGLSHTENTVVGTALRKGISGGERKRVCVGMELLESPRLLFLDEPTSGLDSAMALSLCTKLKQLASELQMAIIMTIHQPQTKIFRLFNKLIILKNGKQVFNGRPDEALQYWRDAGFPLPDNTNPAEFLLDTITPLMGQDKEALADVDAQLAKTIPEYVVDLPSPGSQPQLQLKERTNWFHQYKILLRRHGKEQKRKMGTFFIMALQNILSAVLIGTVYLRMGTTQSSVVRRLPCLFFICINQGVFGALSIINSFPAERTLTLRERAAGTYYVSAYFMAKVTAETLLTLLNPIIFSCIVYFLAGLQPDAGKFFIFMVMMVLCNWAAVSMALLISAFARTTTVAMAILPFILEIARLFGGFFLSPANLPNYFSWLDALSYIKYAFVGVALNELHDLELSCTPSQLTANGTCPITRGEQTIATNGYDFITIGGCIGALVGYIVIARILAFIGIRFVKH